MKRPFAAWLFAIVVAANAGAICLYSGQGPIDAATRAGGRGSAILNRVADLLTLPIPTAGIADVREVILPIALGAALFIVAVAGGGANESNPLQLRLGGAERWLAGAAAAVILLAILSAVVNRSLDLSWGWILRFAVGAAWAMVIARRMPIAWMPRVISALLIAGAACLLLAFAFRADRGYANFTWPIGPITITAAMAALWGAMVGAWAAAMLIDPRRRGRAVFSLAAFALAAFALEQTGRRAPTMGMIAGWVMCTAIILWQRNRSGAMRAGIVAVLVAGVVGAGLYVNQQAASTERLKSGPVQLRMAYWGLSGEMIRSHPLLGRGPDTFVVHMTNAVAPRRSECPHAFHGNIDPYAHNEWIQAAVEMGLPAATVYLALPFGIILLAARRMDDPARRGLILPLTAGLVTICATEAGSITLRGPIMPVWYWTVIGLLAGACRSDESMSRDASIATRLTPAFRQTLLILGAVACFVIGGLEMVASVAQARRQVGSDGRPASRLYADRTLISLYDAARWASASARGDAKGGKTNAAVTLWQTIYPRFAGYEDVPASYANALLRAGREKDARNVLRRAIRDDLTPYSVSANRAYSSICEDDPVEQFLCVRRALRSGALDDAFKETLLKCLMRSTEASRLLEDGQVGARQIAGEAAMDDEPVRGATVEMLRMNAFLQEAGGKSAEAVADQRLAAAFYERLERGGSRYRRAHDAETDAFFTLARMLYHSDPANYREAYDAVVKAERYAVLGIGHEDVANPRPEEGFVIGEVIPTEFPVRLRPLWKLSALLHLEAGDDRNLDFRVWWGLPPEEWTQVALNRELARLARQAYADLSRVPAEKRPAHFGRLPEMAERYEKLLGGPEQRK